MNQKLKKEVEKIIKQEKLNCTVKEFKDKVNWYYISECQKLSESFIKKFKDKVNWYYISKYQKLSESFIKEFKDKVNWYCISRYQKLSESFIKKFKDKVNWYYISEYQKLSSKFKQKHKKDLNLKVQNKKHKNKTIKTKEKEIKSYAKKHNLNFDGKYLYAFRDHDQYGRGMYNKTIFYEKGKYYQDWHCDMDEEEQNSFGLGIFPKGNTKIKVKVEDWGCSVKDDGTRGKGRVWGFEIV